MAKQTKTRARIVGAVEWIASTSINICDCGACEECEDWAKGLTCNVCTGHIPTRSAWWWGPDEDMYVHGTCEIPVIW